MNAYSSYYGNEPQDLARIVEYQGYKIRREKNPDRHMWEISETPDGKSVPQELSKSVYTNLEKAYAAIDGFLKPVTVAE